jgi:hypothetical protein
MKPNTVYGVAYATVTTSLLAGTAMALDAPGWLVITLWALWLVGHVVLIWYCWKITRTDDLEAARLEYLRKARWSSEENYQAEQRCHRSGETPVVYYHPILNVKGTLSGREGGGSE